MKKWIVAILTLVMIGGVMLCMSGCGSDSSKKDEAVKAFNKLSTEFDDTADLINENADAIDEDVISTFQDMSDLLAKYKKILEGDDEISDKKYDEMIDWFKTAEDWIKDSKKELKDGLASNDDSSVFPEALADVEASAIEDLSNTSWQLAGGMLDGTEMEQSDLDAVLEACGGTFQFVFTDTSNVQMISGTITYDGTYELVSEDYAVHAVFDGYEYYGVLTQADEDLVLIIANTQEPEKALYMTQISE